MARRNPESHLTTNAQVLDGLGGDHAVAALTGANYKNVEGWRRADKIPSRYYPVMAYALHKKGLSAPAELWGVVTPAERKKALRVMIATLEREVA